MDDEGRKTQDGELGSGGWNVFSRKQSSRGLGVNH